MKRNKGCLAGVLALCLLLGGCGDKPAASAPEQSAAPPAATEHFGSYTGVTTDWSRLEEAAPAPEADYYTQSPDYCGRTLAAKAGGYGTLRTYQGMVAGSNYGDSTVYLYGLLDGEGRILTAAVYNYAYLDGGCLLLSMAIKTEEASDGWGGAEQMTAAATDGSWVISGDYVSAERVDDTHLALFGSDNSITVVNAQDGSTVKFSAEALSPYIGSGFWSYYNSGSTSVVWMDGIGGVLVYDNDSGRFSCFLNAGTGEITTEPPEGTPATPEEYWQQPDEFDTTEPPSFSGYQPDYTYIAQDKIANKTYYCARRADSEQFDLLDEDGNKVFENSALDWSSMVWDGWVSVTEGNAFVYYDLQGNCKFRYTMKDNND